MSEPDAAEKLAARMERNFRHVAQEKHIEFSVTIASDAPRQIVTDDGKLEQITNNLLGNAFKFTAQGFVKVVFRAADGGKGIALGLQDLEFVQCLR